MTARKLAALRPDLLTEAQLSGLVVELARIGGWKLRYHTLRSKGSSSGFPDWVFVHPGKQRIVFAELKATTKVSDKQREWLDALSDLPGVEVYVWRATDWDEICEVLTGRKPSSSRAA